MTNGEKIKALFPDMYQVEQSSGDWESWWNAEYKEPTTKNNLAVDLISRADAIQAMQDKAKKLTNEDTINGLCGAVAILYEMPSVTPQEPRCKECKWWKDSDGKYRRGCGAESQCPINTHAVYCGEGYCYMFSPKADMREVEE